MRGQIDHKAPVKCVEVRPFYESGYFASMFKPLNWQIAHACKKIKQDPDFKDQEISLVGFSQGGLIARGLVENCEGLQVHTLFTFGTPHAGQDQLPGPFMKFFDKRGTYRLRAPVARVGDFLISHKMLVWSDYIRVLNQDRVQIKLIDLMFNQEAHGTNFLTDVIPYLNNDLTNFDQNQYQHEQLQRERMIQLKNFGLFMWRGDETVKPKESAWFGRYNQTKFDQMKEYRGTNKPWEGDITIQYLKETEEYRQDKLGLRTLDEAGKLYMFSGHGPHMKMEPVFLYTYFRPLIKEYKPDRLHY